MSTITPTPVRNTAGETTERFDPVECVDERERRRAFAAPAGEPGSYLQISGAERTLMIPLSGEVLRIGRGLATDLRLDDASVSRRHALIVRGQGGVRILDDRSFNGTIVNGHRVDQTDLRSGDVIDVGRVRLRYVEM